MIARGLVLAAACCAVLGVAPRARARDLSLRAAGAYAGTEDSAGASSSAFRHSYQLTWARPVSSSIRYSLTLDYQEDIGSASAAGVTTPVRTRLVQPLATVTWRIDDVTLAGRYDYAYLGTYNSALGGMARRDLQTGGATATYMPSPTFLALLSADRYVAEDVEARAESSRDSFGTRIDWRFSKFRLIEQNHLTRYEDRASQATRLAYGPRGELQYSDSFANRLWVNASYGLGYTRSEDAIGGGTPGAVGVEELPTLAVSGRNELPTGPGTSPLVQNPALLDGDFTTSTGVAVGPDGASFWNVGVDMGRVLELDRFVVHVRSGEGAPVPSGGLVRWSVYTSDDGQRWIEAGAVSDRFDPGRSAYVVTFARSAARHFKVVSFGTNTLETYVTEVQVSVERALDARETRLTSSVDQVLKTSISGRPLEKVLLGYGNQANLHHSESSVGADAATRDLVQSFSATVGPFGPWTTSAMHTRRSATSSVRETARSVHSSASLRYVPIPPFDSTLTARTGTDEARGVRGTTHGLGLQNGLRLYREALRLQLGGEVARQIIEGRSSTDLVGGSGGVDVALTASLNLGARAAIQRAIAHTGASPGTEILPIARILQQESYSLEAQYTPAPKLQLGARLGYVETERRGSGLIQFYRVSWTPFQDGTLQLNTGFEQDIDPLTEREFRRISLLPRWNINRNASLDLNYNLALGKEPAGDRRQHSLFATLAISL